MANRLRLANYRFVTDGAAVIGPEPRIGKGKALIDMGLGSTSKLLPDKRALRRSPYGLALNRQCTHRHAMSADELLVASAAQYAGISCRHSSSVRLEMSSCYPWR